jgi:Putative transposase
VRYGGVNVSYRCVHGPSVARYDATGESMPSGLSPDLNRCSIMLAYTHRVAISNNRLLDIEAGKVSFRYKDYRNQSQQKTMTLSAEEFIRRFLLHALPNGFHRIRYYGFLGNRYRQEKLALCDNYWAWRPLKCAYCLLKFRTTVNGAKNSTGFHCASVRFVTVAEWCCWKRWHVEDSRQSRTHHELCQQTRQTPPATRLVPPTLQGTSVSHCAKSSIGKRIPPGECISTRRNHDIRTH